MTGAFSSLSMNASFNRDHIKSVKKSYFNILAMFLEQEKIESRYIKCLLKWGFQLNLQPDDLREKDVALPVLNYQRLENEIDKLESIYHLVFMIYLDEVVEDVELEVATLYAEKLGFENELVGELFKSIATEAYDGPLPRDVHAEVIEFLQLYRQREL